MSKPPKDHGLEAYKHPDRFGEWLGYEVVDIDKTTNVVETRLKVREDHLSPAGRMHGGVMSAFLDFACGAAVFSTMQPKDLTSTIELKVNYLRAIELGDVITARTEVVFRGKRLCVVRGLCHRNGEKDPVAMVGATFNIVSPK